MGASSIKYNFKRLTQEQMDYFLDKHDVHECGKIIIPSYLIKKFRNFTGDTMATNDEIRNHLINLIIEDGWKH